MKIFFQLKCHLRQGQARVSDSDLSCQRLDVGQSRASWGCVNRAVIGPNPCVEGFEKLPAVMLHTHDVVLVTEPLLTLSRVE